MDWLICVSSPSPDVACVYTYIYMQEGECVFVYRNLRHGVISTVLRMFAISYSIISSHILLYSTIQQALLHQFCQIRFANLKFSA